MATSSETLGYDEFRHEAWFYAGLDQFVAGMTRFIEGALAADEPVLVVVGDEKIDRLRHALDGRADRVCFADMADVGRNPACIIPAWRDFLTTFAADGRRVRGIGEPIYPERSPDELAECHRHESLLNVAFEGSGPWWLLCPYDVDALAPETLAEAHRTHPFVSDAASHRASVEYTGLAPIRAPFDAPLPEPPPERVELAFDARSLTALRRHVAAAGGAAGLDAARVSDALVAVTELAINSIRYGGGSGVLRTWCEGDTLVCEVSDGGHIVEPLAGRRRPTPEQLGGRGLWLANHLSDLLQVRSTAAGTVARLRVQAR